MSEPPASAPLAEDDGETPPRRASAGLVLHLEAFDGPIDFLLELALCQKIDLGRISVAALAEQFQAAVAQLAEAPIERRADWLVMAARLVMLKARLLFPASNKVVELARQEAAAAVDWLLELARMRAAVRWLAGRPQLGVDVFARTAEPISKPGPVRAGGYVALMEACLFVLEAGPHATVEAAANYEPPLRRFWTMKEAIERIGTMLEKNPDGTALLEFLPPASPDETSFILRQRAAIAGTLMAGLELAKAGEITLRQNQNFETIHVAAVH